MTSFLRADTIKPVFILFGILTAVGVLVGLGVLYYQLNKKLVTRYRQMGRDKALMCPNSHAASTLQFCNLTNLCLLAYKAYLGI